MAALTGNGNVDLLAAQAKSLGAGMAVTADAAKYKELQSALAGTGIKTGAGETALIEAASMQTDVVVAAIIGFAGLKPAYEALRHTKKLALASKECMVCAGELFHQKAAQSNCKILPLDSEHNGIFQLIEYDPPDSIAEIVLTATGGPFRNFTPQQLAQVTPEQAAKHPVWSMGKKISIDSATLMNKALELIEAKYLFSLPAEKINVLIHPQAIVHGLVRYGDGAVKAHMGVPDMTLPIRHALFWPERMVAESGHMDWAKLNGLGFETPDPARYPALRLARYAMQAGQAACVILNAANEVAVERFVAGDIGFLNIFHLAEDVLNSLSGQGLFCGLDTAEIETLDAATRNAAFGWKQFSVSTQKRLFR